MENGEYGRVFVFDQRDLKSVFCGLFSSVSAIVVFSDIRVWPRGMLNGLGLV